MEITQLSARQIAAAITAGELASGDAVDACIARIESTQSTLNAVVASRFDAARADAAAADRRRAAGEPLGPLHGVPVTIKDSLDVVGLPTTGGFTTRAGHCADVDEEHVARWRSAGAIVLGKTNVAQGLAYFESDNPLYGRTGNPWNLARSCGGSSGGEAAVIASGGSPLGMGTDIAGSLRVPAAFCGIAALMPTAGRLPDCGRLSFHPGQQTVQSQAGVLARDVGDVALGVAVAEDPCSARPLEDWLAVDPGELRVAVYESDGTFPVFPAVRRAVAEAAAALLAAGAKVEAWTPPDPRLAEELAFAVIGSDKLSWLKDLLRGGKADPRLGQLIRFASMPGPALRTVRALVRLAGDTTAADRLRLFEFGATTTAYLDAADAVASYRNRWHAELDHGGFDLIVCPASPVPAVTHGAMADLGIFGTTTVLYNLLGYPAGVVPWTFVRADEVQPGPRGRGRQERRLREVAAGSAGLPIGVQVAGRPWKDHQVIAAMTVIESAAPARGEHPARPSLRGNPCSRSGDVDT